MKDRQRGRSSSGTRMNPLDAVWLLMESADTPMHVGVLAIFHKPARAKKNYLTELAAEMRATPAVPPWNCRLSGRSGPRLVADPQFDLDYHFRRSALPEPGGERELGQVVSRLHSNALDRSRPLWEFHLIEGLERNRFAFYLKVHHALVDAVNGVPLLMALLSDDGRRRDSQPAWARPVTDLGDQEDLADELELPSLSASLEALSALGKSTVGTLRSALTASDGNGVLLPRGTPRSTLNRHINHHRRFATAQIEQARIHELAEGTDSTHNEILAYLCGSTLRRFFKEYNALPDEALIGMMPVSLQERGEHLAGNAIAGLRVALATDVGDPQARLEAIKLSMQAVREERASLPADALTPYVLLRAAPVYARQLPLVGPLVPPLFNLAVSNSHAAEQTHYYNGARLEAIYPMNQLLQFSALSIDCVSYAGSYDIGFTGARDTLPHLQRMAVYFSRAVDDLEELLTTETLR